MIIPTDDDDIRDVNVFAAAFWLAVLLAFVAALVWWLA